MAGYWLNGVKYSNVQLVAGENALSLDYWIGNANLTMMVVPESATSIEGTFQQFPNLAEIVVANSVQVVANLDTAFANTEAVGNDGLFWVADNLLTAYQTAYPTLNFDKWTNYTQYTIPFIGNTELTASYVQQLAQANPAARAAATVIVPASFTSYESGAIDAIFNAFANMTEIESPWLNGNAIDGYAYTLLAGSGNTDASYITGLLSGIGSAIKQQIIKFILGANNKGKLQDGAFSALNVLTNLSSIELDVWKITQDLWDGFTGNVSVTFGSSVLNATLTNLPDGNIVSKIIIPSTLKRLQEIRQKSKDANTTRLEIDFSSATGLVEIGQGVMRCWLKDDTVDMRACTSLVAVTDYLAFSYNFKNVVSIQRIINIYYPSSLQYHSADSYWDITNKNVYFDMTMDQFKQIERVWAYNNTRYMWNGLQVHCADGDISGGEADTGKVVQTMTYQAQWNIQQPD